LPHASAWGERRQISIAPCFSMEEQESIAPCFSMGRRKTPPNAV